MTCPFVHTPETVVFAVDLDSEMASEAVPGCSRFDAVVHAVAAFVSAKKRLDCRHSFGLMTLLDSAVFLPDSVTSSPDELLAALRSLAPAGSFPVFDMASLLSAAEGARAEAARRGGALRVLMIYGRSHCVPARPAAAAAAAAAATARGGLALDCIYVHDKPSPGVNRAQDVYSALEEAVDDISAPAGHPAYVSETGGGNVKKLLTLMVGARIA
ncbi:MAG: hypothetical protein J3K34DRAFT_414454 [Monoraphidium minutum]|nr:MAG: hypothetical protein J3K34DRAFT_414454 [Monoraphidium minutum]